MSGAKPPLPHISYKQISERLGTERTVPILSKQRALESEVEEGSSRLLTFFLILCM
jgi:hypothetical protein